VGDADRLRQVLVNLIGNAIKFTESGAVEIRVEHFVRAGKPRVRFSVQDTGIGIEAEQVETIFQEFTQGDSSTTRRFGGTGLGLAISRRLVEMMGGKIGCESSPGAGSTFWFSLPAFTAEDDAGERSLTSGGAAGPSNAGGRRVLVVEDNPVNRTVAERLLERDGCEVISTERGEDAIRMLREQDFDLVLMDVNMPGMDGLETTAEIRLSEDPGKHVPIVAMTARAMDGDRELCLRAGMDDYISKPVSAGALRSLLDRWLSTTSV
jgi:CheY-like chemotaxis protein